MEKTSTQQQKPQSIVKSYYVKGIQFSCSLEDYVAIRKHQRDFDVETHVFQTNSLDSEYATKEEEIRKAWDTVKPISAINAFKKYSSNAQQFMTVLSIMGPEITFKALKSAVKDTQTIVKTQQRTFLRDDSSIDFEKTKREDSPSVASDLFETREVTYNDTYTLHQINPEQFGMNSGLETPIYVLEVQCPSTHNHYFIFVDSQEEQCQDAIGAVAWTMVKDDGNCLTKEEYLELQSEA